MNMTISDSAFLAYLDCPYKAFLTLQGQAGKPRHFETLRSRLHEKLTPLVEAAILLAVSPRTLSRKCHTTVSDLRRGSPLILNTVLASSSYSCQVAALKRVDGPSLLGDFHYTPIIFHEDATITSSNKLLLAFAAKILGCVQGNEPTVGHVVAGTECTLTRVLLKQFSQQVDDIVSELNRYLSAISQPHQLLNSHCRVCPYHDICESDATSIDHLSRLESISATEINKLNARGIFTVHQLSYTFRPRKRPNRQGKKDYIPYHHSLRALAIREQKIHVYQRPPTEAAATRAYIDMEGDHSARNIYLIGLLVVRDGEKNYTSFWADNRDDEDNIFRELFDKLASLDDCHLFHYGSYDGRALKRMIHLAPTESVKQLLTNHTTNVLTNIYAQVYFPTYGNRLKEVAASLGFKWMYPDDSGKEIILWKHLWDLGHSARIKTLITNYNRDDCMALHLVHSAVEQIAIDSHESVDVQSSASSVREPSETPVSADSLMHSSDYKDWGRREFAREEFRLLADCAYFEYQRNRVYVRTNAKVRRFQRRSKKRSETVATRPTKTIDHTFSVCPRCKSDDLILDYQKGKEKYEFDLRVSRGGIRRSVTKRRLPRHQCLACNHEFVPGTPKSHQRLGHNLLAWAMHQHVSNRISLANLAMTARECFGLELGEWDFQRLKSMAGNYYRDTYDDLLRELLAGPLLHIDETSVWLRGHIAGYVWVFTNMESVVFMYRPTREGEFLQEMLRSFNGVMVTDFYTAYDSIECPQQKCLVHLMWDINRAILKQPFDDELNEIGRTFGTLMRDIIGTIDQFGLKRRYLSKHREQALTWLGELKSPRESVNAERFRKRIVKYGDRLFTFLGYDGVPWNNNNAENSIKPFAKYRRLVRGRITEPGLRDYLVLLSIAHTCKYRGISLLKFFLSGAHQIPD